MDTRSFLYLIEECMKDIRKDLKKLEKTIDLEVQQRNVYSSLVKHSQNFERMKQSKPNDISYYSDSIWGEKGSLESYEKEIRKLRDFQAKICQKISKSREENQKEQQNKDYELKLFRCAYCKNKPPINHYIYSEKNKILKPRKRNANLYKKEYLFCSQEHFEKWHKKNYFCCAECVKEEYTKKYWYRKKENDNKKFCSKQCCNNHYAKTCYKCHQKALGDTYYNDPKNKTGILCSKCNKAEIEENEREIEKIRVELNQSSDISENNQEELEEEEKKVYCRFCGVEYPIIFGVCEKEECLAKMNQEIENKKNTDNGISNVNNNVDIREREREQNQSQQSQLLSEITQLESNPSNNQVELDSKKQQLKDLQTKEKELISSLPIDTQISLLEREIKHLEDKSSKTKEEQYLLESKKKELERLLKKQNSSNTNSAEPSNSTTLYIGCGVVVMLLVFSIFIFARIRKKNRKY